MFFTIFSLWLVRIPLATVLSKYYGTNGIWWSLPVAWGCGLILVRIYYSTGRWKTKAITKPEAIPEAILMIEEEKEPKWNCSKF